MKMLMVLAVAALTAENCCAAAVGNAQDYPNKPLRWIVPFAAGGPTDFAARSIAAKLTELIGQQIVIDVRAGASGIIGSELVANSVPDGYTLLYGTTTTHTLLPALKSRLPYDPVRDFAPISLCVVNPQVLVVANSLGVNSVKEFIALAKAKPGQLNYGSGGQGSTPYFGMELLKSMAGIDLVHVPYKGLAPALTDLMAGQVMAMFYTMQPSVIALAKSGKVKALAVSTPRRSPGAPDLPTVAEAGVPGFEYVGWHGVLGPAKMPVPVVTRLNTLLVRVLTDPELAQRLSSQGLEPAPGTPADFARFMRIESDKLKKVMQVTGMKPE
jgi:tripartite-type tricarboxylate transporter receptor subunit TctC